MTDILTNRCVSGMGKLSIALLAGGDSSERTVSIQGAEWLLPAFDPQRYSVKTIVVSGDEWVYTDQDGRQWPVNLADFSLSINGTKTNFDYAFILIHGSPGEDGVIQTYVEEKCVPYSSCGPRACKVTIDKALCKKTVKGLSGLRLARELVVRRDDLPIDTAAVVADLGLPLIIKPNSSGSSFGVTVAKEIEQIPKAIHDAFLESNAVLIEEYIKGREFGCGVLITQAKEYLFPVTEILTNNEFFDYEAKYMEGCATEITPANLPTYMSAMLQLLAARIYRRCGCRGLVRVDFILTEAGVPYMLEVNSIPGMTQGSIIPKQVKAAGYTMREIVDIIIEDTSSII